MGSFSPKLLFVKGLILLLTLEEPDLEDYGILLDLG